MAKKRIIQNHHISSDPEVTVKIFKGEHWILTQLQRRKNISKGFVQSLRVWLALHEDDAQDLGET